ncbi:MAG TPA: hypothetical protein VIY28_08410 [Pseudonocardiaceae bacterium]
MSRRHPLTRTPLALAALVVACCTTAAVAGCGAGQITQTDRQVAAVDGAYGDVGKNIALRNVLIPYPHNAQGVYPAGSSVPVMLTIINQGELPDELIAVTTPTVGQVLVMGTTTIPPGSSVASISDSTSTFKPTSPLVVGELRIVLNTNQPLHAGLNTPITFVFRNAGQLTLPVPMAAHPDPAGAVVPSGGPA